MITMALACALAQAAAPALKVPYGRLCNSSGPLVAGDGFVISTDHGSVQRHALSSEAKVSTAVAWDGADLLPKPQDRKIYTLSAAGTIPFQWAELPIDLRTVLDADGQGEQRVAYLRGDQHLELAGAFRKRASVLGEIVHSVPLIVGAPPASAGEGHEAFRAQFKGRASAVYAGANDGMLHAFGALDGAELFAYVPRTLIPALPALSDPAAPARTTMDGSAGQADALVGGHWRTVLVSGMGMGARGVFALDITDPLAFADGLRALWEFSDKDDPAIGHVQQAPQIARIKGAWFALVPSAINSAQADGALFLLGLDKPASQSWSAGVNYHRIDTSGADATLPNALSKPALVTAADGSVTLAYAGDLQGRLWRFDLAARTAQLLFTARDDNGRTQPIFHAPVVVFAPGGGYLVLFATGKLIEPADLLPASFLPQSVYAIHDRLEVPAQPVQSRAQLVRRTLSGKDSARIDYFAPDAKRGWFADFPLAHDDGERTTDSPVIVNGNVIVDTVSPGAGACESAASRMYVLDALSGTLVEALNIDKAPTAPFLAPLLVEVSAATGVPDPSGAAMASRTFAVVRPGSPAGSKPATFTLHFPARRMGWREVVNWQELHDAAIK
ncbi:MAG: PilC/PilY family type IV pilus protein [Pseudomonadota bacterium]